MPELIEFKIAIPEKFDSLAFCGYHDTNLRLLESVFQSRIIIRNQQICLLSEKSNIDHLTEIVDEMLKIVNESQKLISLDDLRMLLQIQEKKITNADENMSTTDTENSILLQTSLAQIRAKNSGQRQIVVQFQTHDVVFAIGPAGTGKTYIAVALAIQDLQRQKIKKLILARPAVEAGESLGFLPGDLKEKIAPYLKPLYDALEDMLSRDQLKKYLEQEVIEIIPLAYMRGRTLNNACVILDEAQNSTFAQMKMFLTRLGKNSKAIITGDITQIDLPPTSKSGLISSMHILSDVRGIAFVKLTQDDVVRHPLVKEIIQAYESYSDSGQP